MVDAPSAGLNGGTLVGGAFSVAWFSAIVPATFATGGAGALFMLPFWLAGGVVAKQTLYDPAKSTALSIGQFAWELTQSVGPATVKTEGGPTEELDGAQVEVAAYVNGVPVYVLRLVGSGGESWDVGGGSAEAELEWIAAEVNAHVDALRSG